MEDSADLDGVGIVADEEEPIITNPQPKFFSSLESFSRRPLRIPRNDAMQKGSAWR